MATNHCPWPLKTKSRPGGNEGEESMEGSHIATHCHTLLRHLPRFPPLPPTPLLIFSLEIQWKEIRRSIRRSWAKSLGKIGQPSLLFSSILPAVPGRLLNFKQWVFKAELSYVSHSRRTLAVTLLCSQRPLWLVLCQYQTPLFENLKVRLGWACALWFRNFQKVKGLYPQEVFDRHIDSHGCGGKQVH